MSSPQIYPVLDPETIQCRACAHSCKIKRGARGLCGIRQNTDNKLELLVYSRPSAVHIDPIEKKPMYHYYPGSEILSIGTIGCNFRCKFCQNWSLSMERDIEEANQVLTPSQCIQICKSRGIREIAFTYNEPTTWIEYNLEICRLAKEAGIKTVYVSNGFMSDYAREQLAQYITGINIDLKSFSDETYRAVMGGGVEQVKSNIRYFFEKGVITEVTTLIVPQMNDSTEELTQIAEFLASISKQIPWHLSAFHPDYKMTDRARTPATTLEKAYDIAKRAGLVNVYVGNIRTAHTDTLCPDCQAVLVRRDCYDTAIADLDGTGKCAKCGCRPYGLFTW